jgi:hypothetical protein
VQVHVLTGKPTACVEISASIGGDGMLFPVKQCGGCAGEAVSSSNISSKQREQ